jgi:hypothetical protein
MPLDPLSALANDVPTIQGITNAVTSMGGDASNAIGGVVTGAENAVGGVVTGVENTVGGVVKSATAVFDGLESIFNNFGVFTVGIIILFAGIMFMTFAWGEHLAGAVESVTAKIPAVVPV